MKSVSIIGDAVLVWRLIAYRVCRLVCCNPKGQDTGGQGRHVKPRVLVEDHFERYGGDLSQICRSYANFDSVRLRA